MVQVGGDGFGGDAVFFDVSHTQVGFLVVLDDFLLADDLICTRLLLGTVVRHFLLKLKKAAAVPAVGVLELRRFTLDRIESLVTGNFFRSDSAACLSEQAL